jgi:hypothetical protein
MVTTKAIQDDFESNSRGAKLMAARLAHFHEQFADIFGPEKTHPNLLSYLRGYPNLQELCDKTVTHASDVVLQSLRTWSTNLVPDTSVLNMLTDACSVHPNSLRAHGVKPLYMPMYTCSDSQTLQGVSLHAFCHRLFFISYVMLGCFIQMWSRSWGVSAYCMWVTFRVTLWLLPLE